MVAVPEQLTRWFLHELPRLNRLVLRHEAPTRLVADELARAVLPLLPQPDRLTSRQAQQLVVGLGLVGASVARHHQEEDPRRKAAPEGSFAGLSVGPGGLPFPRYFALLADRTATGHYHRDSYASLVLWNVPTTEVRWRGRTLASLPGVFDDDRLHTYTGDDGERRFFELLKKGEAIELAANTMLAPLAEGTVEFGSTDGVHRVRLATTLLEALRALFVEFATAPPERGMHPHYFMDVFRQFAVHWNRDDIPPSGALDVEALKRDFLLGLDFPDYPVLVRRLMPGLLGRERVELADTMNRAALPAILLDRLGLDRHRLAALSDADIGSLVVAHPELVDWYALLAAHARASGAHLMLSKRFLFNPQRQRDDTGVGDKLLVSNRRGTTGMDESFLGRLTRARKEHALAPLRRTAAVSRAQALNRGELAATQVTTVVGSGRPATDRPAPESAGGRLVGPRQRLVSVTPTGPAGARREDGDG